MISENELITAINKYCVYEAFNKLGFIYSSFMPYKFNLPENKDFCIYFLETKMHNTFDDSKKTLFDSMRNILIQNDKMLKESNFKFGTEKFYFVWEKMLDKAFGIKDKKDYFPKTQWKLNYPKGANSYPLQPDSIMIYANDVYVLDAKYYKYGITANARDLPPTSSIAKQIIYGEYVAKKESDKNIFNAFLMPYNKKKNPFGLDENYANIGYSFGEWRERKSSFEEIQGILIDTKFLFKNFDNQRESLKEKLREMINCNKNSIT